MSSVKVWFRRSALMYAAGTWTVLGVFAAHALFHRGKKEEEEEEQQQTPPPHLPSKEERFSTTISEDALVETTTYTSPRKHFYVSTVSTYKPNFIPYTTRLQNFLQSFFDDNAKKEK
ncbi:small integral membrane protein 26 [Elgaria multicarinata webbii]|uniref:small integral membrane protein 26 n=1 Tax=Elgaria multicarinata webbii TaxID=159646 RepID=UPI002FCCC4A3